MFIFLIMMKNDIFAFSIKLIWLRPFKIGLAQKYGLQVWKRQVLYEKKTT